MRNVDSAFEGKITRFEDLKDITAYMQQCFARKDIPALIKDYESIVRLMGQNSYSVDSKKLQNQLDTIEILLWALWYHGEISSLWYQIHQAQIDVQNVLSLEKRAYSLMNSVC